MARTLTIDPLTTEAGVLKLMRSSISLDAWNANCSAVAAANAHQPRTRGEAPWFERLLITGGLYNEVSRGWDESRTRH